MALGAQLFEDRHHLFAGVAVERTGRFIRQDHLPAVHQGAGDADALLLAAGKLARPVVDALPSPRRRNSATARSRRAALPSPAYTAGTSTLCAALRCGSR